MSPPNGHANGSVGNQNHRDESAHPATIRDTNCPAQFIPEQVRQFVALLEVPFDSTLIEWRVTNTSKGDGKPRGQVIPYADQRAYTDRLNALCSPSGWTRKYTVHTSANFQRTKDQKTVAKIFVTCDLTIFGVGTHSATGEEWTDDDNAGTSAEAQAFKRACSCFGLGRYLYHFTGVWVDLDDRKRPKATPKLADWATPEGWKQGLRPHREADQRSTKPARSAQSSNGNHRRQNGNTDQGEHPELVRQVEAMADPLGKSMYRGLLKTVAQVWKPHQVQDVAVLQKLLVHMQAAERGLRRLDAAFAKTGANPLAAILHTLNLKTLDQVNDLESLHKVVVALEAKAGIGPQPS